MDQFTRKDVTQPKIPDPAPVQKPGDPEEDCGYRDKQGSQPGSGGCPDQPYVAGGFSLVVKNKTSGACQVVDLDFIQDNQDSFISPPAISYSPNPASFFEFDIIDLEPVNTGGPITSYEISGVLPDGLSFDTATGIISGAATNGASDDTYTITAHGPGGDAPTDLEIIISLQTFSIKYLGAVGGIDDIDGDFSVNETRVYDYITKFPSSVDIATRTFWYWFVAVAPGETFYMPGEFPNQTLNPVGVIPTNGLWYYDRAQNDMGGIIQSQLAFNRLNGGINRIAIQCAVVFVGPVGAHLSAITQFQILRASDNAILYDGLADLTSSNPFIGNPFIPSGFEYYYIKVAASSSFNVRVRAAFINGQGSPLARDITRTIASGNWNSENDSTNRFGAPLYITFS